MWNKEYGNSTLPRTQYGLILLLSFTILDVLTYDMKSSGRDYPARYGLDGNINTQAITAYGGDNLTYWDVRLKGTSPLPEFMQWFVCISHLS